MLNTNPKAKPEPLPVFARTLAEMTLPTKEEEARLIAAAKKIEDLAPWEALNEDDLFAVENPEDGGYGFVGVIGGLGEQFGVLLYRDVRSYFHLQEFQKQVELIDPDDLPEFAFEMLKISQIQLMFQPKSDLAPWDLEFLKRNKLTARKNEPLPTFCSLRTGFLPWQVDSAEARFLAVALEQLIELAERPKFGSKLFDRKEKKTRDTVVHELFARVLDKAASKPGQPVWKDDRVKVEPPGPFLIEMPEWEGEAEAIAAKPADKTPVELDFVASPSPVMEKDARPFFPEIILMGREGFVVDQEMTHEGFWAGSQAEFISAVANMLVRLPKRPKTLLMRDPRLGAVAYMAQEMGIEVKWVEELPTLDNAIEEMMGFMGGGMPDIEELLSELPDFPGMIELPKLGKKPH
jgi:hypothetical protein